MRFVKALIALLSQRCNDQNNMVCAALAVVWILGMLTLWLPLILKITLP
jgi:hypothetical protein